MKFDKMLLVKIDRFCAWLLVAVMIVFFVSGYGMTHGFISKDFAKLLHDDILPIPGAIAFAFHSAWGMHIGLKRWKVWGPLPRSILIIYGLAFMIGVIVFTSIRVSPENIELPESFELD